MSSDQKIDVVVIGTGNMGRGHLRILTTLLKDQVAVVGVADANADSLAKAGEFLSDHVPRFNDHRRLLDRVPSDAAIIATPNYTHADVAVDALRAGRHVLCEKPMATTLEGCDRMIEAARSSGRQLQIGLELRYDRTYQRMYELIAQGRIGEVSMVWYHGFRGPFLKKVDDWIVQQRCSGGMIVEKHCHALDLFYHVAQLSAALDGRGPARPVRLMAMGGRDGVYAKPMGSLQPDVLDTAWVLVEFDSHLRACLGGCMFTSGRKRGPELGLIGQTGRLDVSARRRHIEIWEGMDPDSRLLEENIKIEPAVAETSHWGAVYYEYVSFLEAIRTGRPVAPDGPTARWSIRMAVAAQEAIASEGVARCE